VARHAHARRGHRAVATHAAASWHGWPRLTDEQGAPGKAAPDKAVAERAHPSGGSIVRGKEGGGSSTIQGGG
jgi:hypothetical protein